MSLMSDPARRIAAVTPGDSTELMAVRGLLVGGAGDVHIRCKNDTTTVVVTVTAGTLLPIRAQYVMTATTATNIVALY